MKCKFLITILSTVFRVISSEPGPLDFGLLEVGIDYALDSVKDNPKSFYNPPTNNNNSIQYLLYTEDNNIVPCYIEPLVDQFDKCSFNPNHETKFLIHGYVAKLPPDNRFNNHTGVSPETFHCIGHSLGSHICGKAGRLTPNLGRITGLDPDGFSKFLSLRPNIRLRYGDAEFVDVIHTSDIYSGTGLGYLDAIGHMDFYPNGGVKQRHCQIGRHYKLSTSRVFTIQTSLDKALCNHYISMSYFRYSILNNCRFIATRCDSFSSYTKKLCSTDGNAITAEMGFPNEKISGLPPGSKFFLETLEFPPYCKGRA